MQEIKSLGEFLESLHLGSRLRKSYWTNDEYIFYDKISDKIFNAHAEEVDYISLFNWHQWEYY